MKASRPVNAAASGAASQTESPASLVASALP